MSGALSKPPVILTADDDPVTSAILSAYLECEGYEVLVAEDGDQAIAVAKQNPPDAAILDYNLPPTTGADVARALRADPASAHAGIALLTASIELADCDGEEDLWNARLTKPVEQQFLAKIVASLVAGARAQLAESTDANAEEAPPLPEDPLQAEFVTRLRSKVPEMRALVASQDKDNSPGSPLRVLRRHLQQIEGSATMCGFPDIGQCAAEAATLLDGCLQAIEEGAESSLDTVRSTIEEIAKLANAGRAANADGGT
jgi:CheY-like chemotaxis protein